MDQETIHFNSVNMANMLMIANLAKAVVELHGDKGSEWLSTFEATVSEQLAGALAGDGQPLNSAIVQSAQSIVQNIAKMVREKSAQPLA